MPPQPGVIDQIPDQGLEKESGKGPENNSNLAALVRTAQEPDLRSRLVEFKQHLDIDRFINYMILERELGHWNGYGEVGLHHLFWTLPEVRQQGPRKAEVLQVYADQNFSLMFLKWMIYIWFPNVNNAVKPYVTTSK